jgi:hypothetical protein
MNAALATLRFLGRLDATLVVTRPLWRWLGQVALVVLGTHLAADRLDDHLGQLLTAIPVAWPDPEVPFVAGTWTALGLELLVTLWAVLALARSTDEPVRNAREWVSRLSVHNVLGPLFWLPVSLAGSWTIAMAIEDALPTHAISQGVAWTIGIVVAWRLAGSGMQQLVQSPPKPKRRAEGLFWAPPLAVVAVYAVLYGLPIYGALDQLRGLFP